MKHIRLNSGYTISQVGLGTWMIKGEECKNIVKEAINKGYTHIDTALRYENHEAIAQAIKNSKRAELFITSKIWRDRLDYNGVLEQVYTILEELETEYIDLCLIHWPNKDFDMQDTFEALEELVNEGAIRSIGVSNFTINHLKKAIEVSNIPISVNQVEFHYKLYQKELLEFCNKNKITLQAYSPLVHGEFLEDKNIQSLAIKYSKSSSQIILRWLIEKGIVVIPKTYKVERLNENKDLLINSDREFEIVEESPIISWSISSGDEKIKYTLLNKTIENIDKKNFETYSAQDRSITTIVIFSIIVLLIIIFLPLFKTKKSYNYLINMSRKLQKF